MIDTGDHQRTIQQNSTDYRRQQRQPEKWTPPQLCVCCPSTARISSHLLGNSEGSYAIDREWCAQAIVRLPALPQVYLDERAFRDRALQLALRRGIRQFLDLGSGWPATSAVHRQCESYETTRVLYVDIDPLSVAYAEIAANTESTTVDGVRGDLLNPGTFWGTEQTQSLLDAGTPTCLIMTGVLDTIADTPALVDALTRYTERLVPGSLIIVSHASIDGLNPDDPAQATLASHMRAVCEFYRHTHTPARVLRTTAQLTQILDRLTLLEPGIVPTRAWNNPDTRADLTAATSLCLAAVAEVPV